MISRATTNEISDLLHTWCENQDIDKSDLSELLQSLLKVRANGSYRDSIKALIFAFEQGGK
jgi:hypothetical protein